ncbi:MAG: HAD hydrolase-like protein, partial [Phycisphaerae bacterium]|nr:HAD hydrolase-like protein [Phycisphaerae bacterium]
RLDGDRHLPPTESPRLRILLPRPQRPFSTRSRSLTVALTEIRERLRFFIDVYGPELDGRFDEKRELVEFLLRERSLDPDRTIMIGDRARDVESGRTNGTRTIGVTYGFGSVEEIAAAGPDEICPSPGDIRPAVRRQSRRS